MPPTAVRSIESFDEAMDDVLDSPEFRWRLPRIKAEVEHEKSWLEQMIFDSGKWLVETIESIFESIQDFIRWLLGPNERIDRPVDDGFSFANSGEAARVLVLILLAIGGFILASFGIRWWLKRRSYIEKHPTAAMPVHVDLADESITADVLPEDEWLRLAREKWAGGDHRLAVRALFLGTLARLGESGWLAIASGKTNGMYVRELRRQSRATDEMRNAFRDNVHGFESTWYGDHPIDELTFQRFTLNLETIRLHAGTP